MKRTNLVLDERLLEEAIRLSGERTYSATVQRMKARRILDLSGSGLWHGDLSSMRDDHPRKRRPKKTRVSR